jgi:hypothetical protein
MVTELAVRSKLADFLSGQITLADLDAWLGVCTWNAHLDSAPAAQELAADIELALYEYGNGDLSEAEFREELVSLAETISTEASVDALVRGNFRTSHTPTYQVQGPTLVPLGV